MERLNKEYKLNINNNFVIKYGTIDRNNPQVIYICGKTWICPNEELNFINTVECIKTNFRQSVKTLVTNNILLDNKFVCDFDVNGLSLNINKKNYVAFEIFLKQNQTSILSLKDVGEGIKTDLTKLIEKLYNIFDNYNFSLSKSK